MTRDDEEGEVVPNGQGVTDSEKEFHPQSPSTDTENEKQQSKDNRGAKDNGDKSKDNKDESEEKDSKQNKPAGGYDTSSIPDGPNGYTVKFTFHKATALPIADLGTRSSDPYFTAQLYTDIPQRHKEDPRFMYRSKVIWRNTNPEWNDEWIVAGVPPSGFKLKVRIYDEDVRDNDDRLGNVHLTVPKLSEKWEGIDHETFTIKKRMASKRAYLIRALAVCMAQAKHMSGHFVLSAQVLGPSGPEAAGRMYTLGPCTWSKHFSPLLGRITHSREDPDDDGAPPSKDGNEKKNKKQVQQYRFEANQLQLKGPVPKELYHRFVEFRPIIARMFTAKGLRGVLLSKALHVQHNHVYNHSPSTLYGSFPGPSREMTLKFLEFVHYDNGGRIFTYVLTLDGLWRFTETGKEFGIDMLSKHTMHSEVSMYIAFSGEFFIRRIKHPHRNRAPSSPEKIDVEHPRDTKGDPDSEIATHPPDPLSQEEVDRPPKDPTKYQLIIDNDSGTYRPNAALLPNLKAYLERNLPGLEVITLDCQADADKMSNLKDQQREAKKQQGGPIAYTQLDRRGSVSSSDESRLGAMDEERQDDKKKKKKNITGMDQEARRALKRAAVQRRRPRKDHMHDGQNETHT